MASNSGQARVAGVQAGAAVVQAVAAVVDNAFNLGNLTSSIVQASTTLENIHSRMRAKKVDLDKITRSVKDIFQMNWFSKKRFDSWLSEVAQISGQVHALEDKISNSFLAQFLNEEIGALCTELDRVIKEGKELRDAMMEREIKRVVKLVTPVSIKNISDLMKQLKQILEYLRKEENISTIRVYGEVGTGKRAVMEHLNNHLFENWNSDMFDIVIWVPATDHENHDNIETHIRDIIVRRLGLNVGGNNDSNMITTKIQEELDGVKYLLLLDDIKEDFELQAIGIPKDTKGSKIVFATSLPYLHPFGKCFFNIHIKRLNKADSQKMFEDILIKNDSIQQHNIGIIAYKVVKWCDGLFVLIKMVAENFKLRTSESSWNAGLKMLHKSAEKGDIYMKAFENFLHFSYDGLDENQKRCFLFAALYPDDSKIPIDCLFDCWIALKLHKYDVKKESVHEILDHLLQKALLKKCSDKQYVTMDKVFKGAAIKILQQHETIKCQVARKAFKELKENRCKDTHWISLANGGIQSELLPTQVECPEVTTFFLQKNLDLKDISNFFDSMKKLTILDLHETGIESTLPLCNLESLKVLYVNGCNMLGKVPFKIVGLGSLEVLDMRDTITNEMLDDVKKLKNLRRLLLSINGDCDMNSLDISQFSSLKELIIDVKSDSVGKNEHLCTSCRNEIITNTIDKIDNLKKLTTLQFRFKEHRVDVIQVRGDTSKIFVPKQCSLKQVLHKERDLFSKALQVYIGFEMSSNREIPKTFHKYDSFVLSSEKIVDDGVIENVFTKVKSLILINNDSIKHLDGDWITQRSMNHIENCLVQRCSKIETLMQSGGFLGLKTLVLSECYQFKVLFSNDLVHEGIEHLEIRNCPSLEEINLSTNVGVDVLPKLTNLILYDLCMLKRISCVTKWPSANALKIHECGMLTELPLDINSGLRSIEVEKIWWENLQLSNEVKTKFEQCMRFRCLPVW